MRTAKYYYGVSNFIFSAYMAGAISIIYWRHYADLYTLPAYEEFAWNNQARLEINTGRPIHHY
jgi:hypothetical protein